MAETRPNLYVRTFDDDELVLLAHLLHLAHTGIVEAGGYPESIIERTVALRLRVIGDAFAVREVIR